MTKRLNKLFPIAIEKEESVEPCTAPLVDANQPILFALP